MNHKLEIPEKLICTVLFLLAFFLEYPIMAAIAVIIMMLVQEKKVQRTAGYILIIILAILIAKYPFYLLYKLFRYISVVISVNEPFITTLYRISTWISDVLLILGRVLFVLLAFLSYSGKDYSINVIDGLFAKQNQRTRAAAPDQQAPVQKVPVQPVQAHMYCEHCGKPVMPGDRFCLSCGKPVQSQM